MLFEEGESIVPRVTGVNDDRHAGIASDTHLLNEHGVLAIAIVRLPVIIDSDLTHGDYFRVLQKLGRTAEIGIGRLRRVLRMDADSGADAVVRFGDTNAGFQIRRTLAGPDSDHLIDARFASAVNSCFSVGLKLLVVEVAVGVDQHLLQSGADGSIFQEAG